MIMICCDTNWIDFTAFCIWKNEVAICHIFWVFPLSVDFVKALFQTKASTKSWSHILVSETLSYILCPIVTWLSVQIGIRNVLFLLCLIYSWHLWLNDCSILTKAVVPFLVHRLMVLVLSRLSMPAWMIYFNSLLSVHSRNRCRWAVRFI